MKKIFLILLCLAFFLGLAGCSAPKSEAESTYLEAQKESFLSPGTISISSEGTLLDVPIKEELKGTADAEGNALLEGSIISSSFEDPLKAKYYISKNGNYMRYIDDKSWDKIGPGFTLNDYIIDLPFKEIKKFTKVSKVFDGKNTSVYKYSVNLTKKSISKLGLTSFFGAAGSSTKLTDAKYDLFIDPKTKKIVGFDIAFTLVDSDMQLKNKISYTADSKVTVEIPTDLE